MKKLISAALAVSMLFGATLFAGCKVGKETNEKDEIEQLLDTVDFNAGKDYTGKVKVLYQDIPSETKVIRAVCEEFQKEYPNITIEYNPVVETQYLTQIPNKHATAYRTQNFADMPDIIWTTNEILAGWVAKDMLMPVNYFDAADGNFSAEDIFVNTMLADSMLGDNVYMFPRDYDQIVMYYNRELLAKANIPESRIPSDRALTATEFNALLKDIRDAFSAMEGVNERNNRDYDKVRSLDALFAWGSLCWPTLKSFGGSVMADDGSVKFNTSENIAATVYVRELIKNEYVFGGTTKHAQFINHLTPLCFETRATLTALIDQTADGVPGIDPEDLGVAPMPMLGDEANYSIGAGCSGYGMYRYTQNPTAAWLFLKFLASEKGQNAISRTGNIVPSNKNLLFQEDAVWRNLTAEEFSGLKNFNHDAFVYAWDTAACTLQDFKLKIDVVAAREAVSKNMTDVMKSALTTKDATYAAEIATLYKNGESRIRSTIEGYRQ